MKAFIGHSFDEKDEDVVNKIKSIIASSEIECVSGDKVQNSSVAEKVKTIILLSPDHFNAAQSFNSSVITIDPLDEENSKFWNYTICTFCL